MNRLTELVSLRRSIGFASKANVRIDAYISMIDAKSVLSDGRGPRCPIRCLLLAFEIFQHSFIS